MSQQPSGGPSVGQIALGTMLGNIGCLVLWFLFSCLSFLVLSVLTPGVLSAIQRNLR